MKYSGFWATNNGVKFFNKKIEAIKNTSPPTTHDTVCMFMGLVSYYHNRRERLPHKLPTLSNYRPVK